MWTNSVVLPGQKRGSTFIPKAGCTSWKLAFARHLHSIERVPDHDIHLKKGNAYLNFLRTEDLGTPGKPLLKNYEFFCMVRNPYVRVLSAHLDKLSQWRAPGAAAFPARVDLGSPSQRFWQGVCEGIYNFQSDLPRLASEPGISFLGFLLWVESEVSKGVSLNEHWQTQKSILNIDFLNYEFTGKLETSRADSAFIIASLGFGSNPVAATDVRHASLAMDKLAINYTPATKALVERVYADDFATFNYPLTLSDDWPSVDLIGSRVLANDLGPKT